MESTQHEKPWFLQSSFPVEFPPHHALTASRVDFEAFIADELERHQREKSESGIEDSQFQDDAVTEKSQILERASVEPTPSTKPTQSAKSTPNPRFNPFSALTGSTTSEVRQQLDTMEVDSDSDTDSVPSDTNESPFMQGLLAHAHEEQQVPDMTNRMATENNDLAYRSTKNAQVDLFSELETVISGPRLRELLGAAWEEDPLVTLKIIFNARSIHLGKGSRGTFYRAAGWLAQNHPLTLVANLRWLTRPVIEKKLKKVQGEEDMVFVESGRPEDDNSRYDIKYGVAHGYWKDLPNLLALAVNNSLHVLAEPRDVLNSENPGMRRGKVDEMAQEAFRREKRKQDCTNEVKPVETKTNKREQRDSRHEAAVKKFNENPVYRALHLTIARLFADQLAADVQALRSGNAAEKRNISLCGKWAPSSKNFHDRHTFLASSIAEIMHPRSTFDESLLSPAASRETYLRWARERYRQDVSSLRKHLGVVERKLTAKDYESIDYETVPSLAMNAYTNVFIERDFDRFDSYMEKVADGTATISGATLLPSTLIKQVRECQYNGTLPQRSSRSRLVEEKRQKIQQRVYDGQWNTIVQRIKNSGTLTSCMAVCDVSGSMMSPTFPDGTCPMDSAIGLSLLMAEVVEPPFGGAFITFSTSPTAIWVDLTKDLKKKYDYVRLSRAGLSTNLVATFERLILPMAIKNKVKPEDMVKRLFVFSDMHFDSACGSPSKGSSWTSSYDRIKGLYQSAGYEMPEMVFWNLAGGRASHGYGDPTVPKQALADEPGVVMVSGYSQGMLKVFMDGGGFDDEGEEEEVMVVSKDGQDITVTNEKKQMDSVGIMNKAIGHKAYDMLKVLD